MLVLIEGIDRTGKSTLAERLAAFTGGTVTHFSKPEAHPLYEYTAWLATFAPARSDIILDRSHVGESVWPYVFDRDTSMDEPIRRWLNMFYMSRGAVLIHATRDADAATAQEFEDAGEPIHLLGDIQYASHLFRDAVSDCGLPVWEYQHGDWPGGALHEAARRAVIAGELLGIAPRYVGSAAPRVLLVGPRDTRYMPFMPYDGTDAHFLMGELDDWRQVALATVAHPDTGDVEPVERLWHALGRPHVITFGSEAADTVKESGLPHTPLGTLSQFRRFTPPGSLRESVRRYL
jgi:hypothetical protein